MAQRPGVAAAGGIERGVLASYFAVTVLWGLNWPAMKVVVGAIDPWTFRTGVLVLAAATLFALARALGSRSPCRGICARRSWCRRSPSPAGTSSRLTGSPSSAVVAP